MATQKQRRRRAKEKRHEYEIVEIDGEGNETVLRASDLKSETQRSTPAKSKSDGAKAAPLRQRGVPQPPSWPRVLKRGALFAPVFLAMVLLLGGNRLTFGGALVQTVLLLAVFVPFSYFMDRFVWRSYEKRLARSK